MYPNNLKGGLAMSRQIYDGVHTAASYAADGVAMPLMPLHVLGEDRDWTDEEIRLLDSAVAGLMDTTASEISQAREEQAPRLITQLGLVWLWTFVHQGQLQLAFAGPDFSATQ